MTFAPTTRVRNLTGGGSRDSGEYVLYWMVAARRTRWNFGLQHAAALAREVRKPLLVLEPLRAAYPWASDRLHRFVIEGMRDNRAAFARQGVAYYPFVERVAGEGQGLLEALSERAVAVVTDDSPAFFLPRMLAAAAERVRVRFEAVDGNGLLPMRATAQVFTSAHQFRRHLHGVLPEHHGAAPAARLSVRGLTRMEGLPQSVLDRWPPADLHELLGPGGLARVAIDHGVPPVDIVGGERAARRALTTFVDERLADYGERRNEPAADATSGLSPYLHFGHVSAHEVVDAVLRAEAWSPGRVNPEAKGKRAGWWGVRAGAEGFLDQLVTWREVGFNACTHLPGYDRYDALPEWALRTLEAHAADPREHVYVLEQLETAETHDPLWNAAQRQLLREGRIHNYLRMLWGKKILEWSPSPEEALDVMVELNDRYAVDGRDPNSTTGIMWVLGRYDRPWGPARPVFGTVRYMSSENTARKFKLAEYLERYGSVEK